MKKQHTFLHSLLGNNPLRMKQLISVFCFLLTSGLYAQGTIERQAIGTTGNESSNGTTTISSTTGEVAVQTLSDGTIFITQGFQQPTNIIIAELDLHFYNGITPNGDGSNETWIIDGIEQYPDNEISIFGRSGNLVWIGSSYDNTLVVFEGLNQNSNELPNGTYFYVMNITSLGKKFKGWIEITR